MNTILEGKMTYTFNCAEHPRFKKCDEYGD